MALSQIQLSAFLEVSRLGSFTQAAAHLAVTQSALSHRIKNLEAELETTLFIRRTGGVELTEAGHKLLKFCRLQTQAEEEFLADLLPATRGTLSGTLRIGGASTLMRSLVLPALADLLRANPNVRLELSTRELRDLPALLTGGRIDFLVVCGEFQIPGAPGTPLGFEENVLIESRRKAACKDVYLDHDLEDQTTFRYLRANGRDPSGIKRSFLNDIYGLVDGVAEGLGRAVAPRHLIRGRGDVKVVPGWRAVKTPVYLHQMKQPYYTRLHQRVASCLIDNVRL